MIIRKAIKEDVELLEEINVIANKESSGWGVETKEEYREFLSKESNSVYLGFEEDLLIGFLSVEYNVVKKRLWINDVYVLSEHRNKGVAKALFDSVVSDWGGKANTICLLAPYRNLSVFEKLGFDKTMNFMELKK